jgi:hypothetical protein
VRVSDTLSIGSRSLNNDPALWCMWVVFLR